MESWENKILAEKLNSLDSLPEGYAPDITSKWEIVQSGLSRKKSMAINKRWLALSLLALLVIVCVVYVVRLDKAVISDNKILLTLPAKQNASINKELTRANTAAISVAKKEKQLSVVSSKQNIIKADTGVRKIIVVELPHLRPDSILQPQLDTLKIAPPFAQLKSKPKRRTFQKDFDGLITNADTTQIKTAQKAFKLKFGSSYEKEPGTQQTPALRLIQNF